MKRDKVKFYVERDSFGVEAFMILMALSIVFRIVGCWGLWTDKSYAILQIALPVVSALLLIACVALLGKRALWLTFIPVTLGIVFFIVKALDFPNKLQMILCILFYIAVMALYFCTVFGILKTKWILVPLFGLPFLYHIFIRDLKALQDTANPVSFSAGMQEMGILSIMLALFFLSLSIKKQVREEEQDLPKIKAPIVLAPQQTLTEDEAEPAVAGTAKDGDPDKETSEHETQTENKEAVRTEE